jgi:transcriptional regulator with XRE-family HTH domain
MKRTLTRGARLLVEWRTAAGMTALKAANLLELDPARYSAYERGRQRPRIDKAKRIFEVTGGAVPIDAWADIESIETMGPVA